MEQSSFSLTQTNFIKLNHEWTIQSACLLREEGCIRGGSFIAGYGNITWRLGLLLRPTLDKYTECVFPFLELVSSGLDEVVARFRFSILDHRRHELLTVPNSKTFKFSRLSKGQIQSVSRNGKSRAAIFDHLDALRNDDLIVCCEIWMRIDPVTVGHTFAPPTSQRSRDVPAGTSRIGIAEPRKGTFVGKVPPLPAKTTPSLRAIEKLVNSIPTVLETPRSTMTIWDTHGELAEEFNRRATEDDNDIKRAVRSKKKLERASDMNSHPPGPSSWPTSLSAEQLSSSGAKTEAKVSEAKCFNCYVCNLECRTRSDLSSHMRFCHGVLKDDSSKVISKIAEYNRQFPSIPASQIRFKLIAEGICCKKHVPLLSAIKRLSLMDTQNAQDEQPNSMSSHEMEIAAAPESTPCQKGSEPMEEHREEGKPADTPEVYEPTSDSDDSSFSVLSMPID